MLIFSNFALQIKETEDRRWKTEDGRPKMEDRRWKTEDGRPKMEV
jgi:hypothetical protein